MTPEIKATADTLSVLLYDGPTSCQLVPAINKGCPAAETLPTSMATWLDTTTCAAAAGLM